MPGADLFLCTEPAFLCNAMGQKHGDPAIRSIASGTLLGRTEAGPFQLGRCWATSRIPWRRALEIGKDDTTMRTFENQWSRITRSYCINDDPRYGKKNQQSPRLQAFPENIQIIEFRHVQNNSDIFRYGVFHKWGGTLKSFILIDFSGTPIDGKPHVVTPWRYLPAFAAGAWLSDFLSLCRNQLMERLVSQLMGWWVMFGSTWCSFFLGQGKIRD